MSAGAGSGKTTVLVERFLDLVRGGSSPASILAITYTEKAAAEMKERIVRRFEREGDDANRRAAEAAYISTIHGFCARLLRENALAAGLDPAFRIVDDLLRGIFLDEQLEMLYEDEWFLTARDRFKAPPRWDGRPVNDRPVLFELIREAAFLPAEFGRGVPAEAALDVEGHVQAALARCDAHWETRCNEVRDLLLEHRDMLGALTVSGPAMSAKYEAFVRLLRALASDSVIDPEWAADFCENTGFTRTVKDACVGQVRAVVQAARAVLAEFKSFDREAQEVLERTHAAPLKVGIHRCATDLRRAYDGWKRDGNRLDFEDLQRRALRLLEHPEVRAEYAGAFEHILLDEAQDANDIQMALIAALRTGRQQLFAVGDVKQAIYGFRGANVALFQGLHSGAGHGQLSLLDNYRSRREVLALVNESGARMWSGDGTRAFAGLVPRLEYPGDPAIPALSLCVIEQQKVVDPATGKEGTEPSELVTEREATVIAAWIRAAVEGSPTSAPLTITDPQTRVQRPVRYGDIAILAMKRRPFDWYERSLATVGVPFVKGGGRGFFVGREIQDLLALLRTVSNPLDDTHLLAALRSPLFGWLDADLVRLREAAGDEASLWRGMPRFRPARPRSTADALQTILTLRRWALLVAPCVLIELACDLTAFRATLLRGPRGRAQVANIEKLIEFARITAMMDGSSLDSFVRRAELAERHLGSESDAPVAATGDDVVTLSTIHGAKGLEWPIVILASLDTDFARADAGSRYIAPDGALLLELRDPVTDEPLALMSNDVLKAAARERDQAEAKRLFYVAMTRAREHLVLAGRSPASPTRPRSFGSPLRWLLAELGIDEALAADGWRELGVARLHAAWWGPERVDGIRDPYIAAEERALKLARGAVRAGAIPEWPLDGRDAQEGRNAVARILDRAAPPAPRRAATTTVTRLSYFARCPLVYYHNLVLQVEEHPLGRRKAAASVAGGELSALERGTLVHGLLERAALDADPGAEAARLAAEPPDIADAERARLRSMLARVLADPLLDRARRSTRLEREYPFYLDLDGTTVHGVIDLVFADVDGRGVVVDYKSNDLAAPDRVTVLTEHYRPQIELYALAAQRAGLVDPSEATLYFLNTAEARTRPVDERRLAIVEEDATTMVASIARGAWDTEPGEKCRRCGYRKRGFCEVGKRFRD